MQVQIQSNCGTESTVALDTQAVRARYLAMVSTPAVRVTIFASDRILVSVVLFIDFQIFMMLNSGMLTEPLNVSIKVRASRAVKSYKGLYWLSRDLTINPSYAFFLHQKTYTLLLDFYQKIM